MALVKKKRGERGEKQQPDFNYFIARREEEIFWKKDKESLGFALKVSSGFERTGVLDLGSESGWRWWRTKRHCSKHPSVGSSKCPCFSCWLNKTELMPDSQPLAILRGPIFSLSLKPMPPRHIYLLPNHLLTWLSPDWSTLDYLMGHSLCFCCREDPVPTPLLHSLRSSLLDRHQSWLSCSETIHFVLCLQSPWCSWPSGFCPHLILPQVFNRPTVENMSSVTAYHGSVWLNFVDTGLSIQLNGIAHMKSTQAWFMLTSSPDITILGPVFLLMCSALNFSLVCWCFSANISLFKSLSPSTNPPSFTEISWSTQSFPRLNPVDLPSPSSAFCLHLPERSLVPRVLYCGFKQVWGDTSILKSTSYL